MSKEKAELVDRLNAIQRRISELGLWASQELIKEKEKIEAQLDFISKQEKDGRN